ncbi:hypothetical protein N8009_02540 [Flavobacteriaceae bacterium]|nr:hypothetical protein [Flavobacteriaceae bacterium]
MTDTITIPTELLKDIVDVNNRLVEHYNRLKACSNRSPEDKGSGTSLKGGEDRPNLPSKKAKKYNEFKKLYGNI